MKIKIEPTMIFNADSNQYFARINEEDSWHIFNKEVEAEMYLADIAIAYISAFVEDLTALDMEVAIFRGGLKNSTGDSWPKLKNKTIKLESF